MNEVMKDVKHYLKTLYVALEGGPKSLDRQTLALAIGSGLLGILVDAMVAFYVGFGWTLELILLLYSLVYFKFYVRPDRQKLEKIITKIERKNKWKQKIIKLKLSK